VITETFMSAAYNHACASLSVASSASAPAFTGSTRQFGHCSSAVDICPFAWPYVASDVAGSGWSS
jgi:hypothetical protein